MSAKGAPRACTSSNHPSWAGLPQPHGAQPLSPGPEDASRRSFRCSAPPYVWSPSPSILQYAGERTGTRRSGHQRGSQRKSSLLPSGNSVLAPMACVCCPGPSAGRARGHSRKKPADRELYRLFSPPGLLTPVFAIQNSILVRPAPPRSRISDRERRERLCPGEGPRSATRLYPDIPQAREAGLCYIPITNLPKISFGVFYLEDDDHPVLKRFLTLIAQYLGSGVQRG